MEDLEAELVTWAGFIILGAGAWFILSHIF